CDVIVWMHDLLTFYDWDRIAQLQVYLIWQTGRDSVYIILACLASFRFEKELMRRLVRKFDDFVFNRRAVSGSSPLDAPGVERRSVEVCPNDIMRLPRRVRNPTWHLFHVELTVSKKVQF